MTFLPIVERELRVAARRPGTWWTRWFAALGLIAVWLVLLAANWRDPADELSMILFATFGALALAFCLLAGIFLTADCLSEEKREGTLGLLFLTDLRGYDVVLGKLMATSVHSVYGLLAMFPVLALPLMMGGVTVGEFWRVVAVLLATLLLSLGLGMCISAAVRESRHAMAGTFLGMLVLAGAVPAFWWLAAFVLRHEPPRLLLWPSPVNTFISAFDFSYRQVNGPLHFWMSLQTVFGLGIGLLALAAVWLPRSWQEKAKVTDPALSARRPSRLPQSMAANPYGWVTSRSGSFGLPARGLVALLVLLWLCALLALLVSGRGDLPFMVCLFTAYALHQVGKYLIAVEATRQLSEDRRSGALELLLVTPLGDARILSGQRWGILRHCLGLIVLLLLVNLCTALATLLLAQSPRMHMEPMVQVMFMQVFLGGAVMLFADFWALQTAGMWVALRARRHQRAVLGSLARVMVAPWVGFFLLMGLGPQFRPSEAIGVVLIAFWFAGGIVNDLVVCANARAGLGWGLRYWLAEGQGAGERQPFLALEPLIPKAASR